MRILLKCYPDCQIWDIRLLVEQGSPWVHVRAVTRMAVPPES